MAVLVTGGAGYIGSVAVEKLLAAGEDVVVLDDLSTGHRAAIEPRATVVEGRTQDPATLERVFAAHVIDTVMHFAAFIQVGESYADPAKYFDNNVAGAHNLLSAMVRAGVKRFVFSSTAAVYGDPEDVPIPEEHPKRPINPYGLSKRMVEQMLEWFDRAYGLRYVALRYFNACGATEVHGEDHEPESHLIPNILMAATGDRPAVQVFGTDYDTPDGTCIRDYVHVADLIGAHLLAMRHLREDGASGVFNLGSEAGFSVLEIIEAVRRVTGHEVPVEYGPRRSGDADRLIAASGRARETLGWRPERSDIDIIIRDAYAWRQTHPRGYGTEPS